MSWRGLAACALMMAPLSAQGQAFNIDLDLPFTPAPLGGGVPPDSFGAAASQPGYWTLFSGPATPLTDITGATTAVRAVLSGDWNGSSAGTQSSNSLEYAALMHDVNGIGTVVTGGTAFIDVTGLANGPYRVYVYATHSRGGVRSWVSVPGSITPDPQLVTGPAVNSYFAHGITHSIHSLEVTDGHLRVTIAALPGSSAAFAGMQIVPAPGAVLPLAVLMTFGCHRRRLDRLGSRSCWGTAG